MAMIYRRNPHGGGRLTTTIPLNDALRQSQLEPDNNAKDDAGDTHDEDDDGDDDTLPSSASPSPSAASSSSSASSSAASRPRRLLVRGLRCLRGRKTKTKTPTGSALNLSLHVSTNQGLSFRVCQILWLALLVYAFFGLPVLGRILNFCRYFHRFTGVSIVTGLVVGFLQDVAIFVQASTVIVLIKALFQPVSLQRRLSSNAASASSSTTLGAASSTSSLGVGGASLLGVGSSTAMAATLAQERYPHSAYGGARYMNLPVYVPVRANEYETHASSSSTAESDPLDPMLPSQVQFGAKHLTLVASSSSTVTSFPWSLSSSTTSMSPTAMALAKLRNFSVNVLVLLLVKVVLILATIASVADFCLQITMHPRLNRAFVEIFFNYMAQFTASLTDEEVLTPAVVFTWTTYMMLMATLTFGFYTERLPFLPDVLNWSSSSSSSSGSSWSNSIWCCCLAPMKRVSAACMVIMRRRRGYYRKDSSLPPPSSSTRDIESGRSVKGATGFFNTWLFRKQTRRKDSDIIILSENTMNLSAPSAVTRSGSQRRRRNSSVGHSHGILGFHGPSFSNGFGLFGGSGSHAFGGNGHSATWLKPKTPLGIVLHCIVVSVFVSLGALCASLIVHTSTGAMSGTGKHHGYLVGVDVQLMANPMFSLQTENFFTRKNRIGADHINCTAASHTLLQTLGKSEVYDTTNMGNDDSCALLWRKTTAYQGETLWDINWNVTSKEDETSPTPVASTGDAASTPEAAEPAKRNASTKLGPRPPNIIVINMESWRYLDVGVLGGAAKKAKYGKSATPNFDRLSKEGVLYRKHYTQCVQTTRTLLTTLFGMLPSCTETTALKMYGTGLKVRGLPQYLKSRGYFNMFWSAVDLSWEYWDKFLMMNGFDKLVDDKKVRKMLHETKNYKDRDDDHFSWGMHDHLSFDMLLYAIETSKNNTNPPAATAVGALITEKNSTAMEGSTASAELLSAESTVMHGENATADGMTVPAPLPPSFTPRDQEHKSDDSTKIRGGHSKHDKNRDEKSSKTKKGKQTPASGPASVGPEADHKSMANAKRRIRPIVGWEGLQEPYFINMYTITSHNPWALPADYSVPDLSELYTRFNKRYIDSMYFSDDMLGQFVDNMRAKGLMKNTIVIVEGDHGYGRLEHDNNPSIADSALYDEATHVPFLILADDFLAETEKGTQVDQLTMQSDLMATIADIVGVSADEPLLQHGYGHSMRRKRSPKAKVKDVDFELIHDRTSPQDDDERDRERRVLLCNPFNGATKGTRTEELKYVFSPDGSFKVFELAADPVEKRPVESGYDAEQMSDTTREVLDYVTEHVDLNQFLFETNKFITKIPLPVVTPHTRYIKEQGEATATATAIAMTKRKETPRRDPQRSVVASMEPEPLVPAPASPVSTPAPEPVEMEREVATPSARAPPE